MKPFLLLLLSLSSVTHAFTLNNNFGAAFKDSTVKVYIDELSHCPNSLLTIYNLKDMIDEANDRFWNRVPTSKLKLISGGFSPTTTNITTGRLCAPTDETCITAAGGTVIPPVDEIVISCNNNGLNFGGDSVLAVTVPNNFSGKKITGAVILIQDTTDSLFQTLSRDQQIAVIAHEIGHAIGLGHTDQKPALMYFKSMKKRRALGKDDMKGVSYLYPMQMDGGGVLGGCGTIQENDKTPPKNPPFWQMGAMLFLVISLVEIFKLLKRANTSSAA